MELAAGGVELGDLVLVNEVGQALQRAGARKDCFYEGAARVPLVVSWPGRIPSGAVREQLAGLADVVPTILDAAGIGRERAAALGLAPDGVSLLPAARDGVPTRDVLVGLVGQGMHAHLAAITPEWKYIYSAADNRELLFSYRQPGGELRDLAGASGGNSSARDVCAALRGVVQERLVAAGARPAAELLDPGSPTGFRLIAGGHAAQRRGAVEDSHWLRRAQYPGWVGRLPDGWQPPPPRGDSTPANLPLRSDRAPYTWAPHGPPVERRGEAG